MCSLCPQSNIKTCTTLQQLAALTAAQVRIAELGARCCGCCRQGCDAGGCPYNIDEKGGRCCTPGGECLSTHNTGE